MPFNPDVGYIVASSRDVFLTSNNLATPAALKAASAGNRIAGDPQDPSRMWSSSGDYTRDGWHTDAGWRIGNANARVYPSAGRLVAGAMLLKGDPAMTHEVTTSAMETHVYASELVDTSAHRMLFGTGSSDVAA